MPKSIRFSRQLEESLDRASRTLQVTHSEFIREAVEKRCDEVLATTTLFDCLDGTLGTVNSAGGRAHSSGNSFRRVLRQKRT